MHPKPETVIEHQLVFNGIPQVIKCPTRFWCLGLSGFSWIGFMSVPYWNYTGLVIDGQNLALPIKDEAYGTCHVAVANSGVCPPAVLYQ